jgi:hypothetical protein
MPIGDCERARLHHALPSGTLVALAGVAGSLCNKDSNHASVTSDVVHTSRLGPAARYNGIFAVSTVVRKRSDVYGRVDQDATFGDARPTSRPYQQTSLAESWLDIPLIVLPSGSRMSPLHMSTMTTLLSSASLVACTR